MNVRYQVFISSTFRDFESERKILTQALLKIDCFPAGMEWFPAADEEQFNYIKQVIDASDYYVLVLGGLYGTIAPDGKSYTEKEYDYAVSIGKKITPAIFVDHLPHFGSQGAMPPLILLCPAGKQLHFETFTNHS